VGWRGRVKRSEPVEPALKRRDEVRREMLGHEALEEKDRRATQPSVSTADTENE
jgi:hypothetical protein